MCAKIEIMFKGKVLYSSGTPFDISSQKYQEVISKPLHTTFKNGPTGPLRIEWMMLCFVGLTKRIIIDFCDIFFICFTYIITF